MRCALAFFCVLIPSLALGQVKPGIEVLIDSELSSLKGKRVGLITNPTGVTSKLESTIDVLHGEPDIELAALFGPEHGVRGDQFAGKPIDDTIDGRTGVPVFSLYGEHRAPTKEMLKDIDVLIYDIQDIGSRAYTYIYTMALSMQAAAEHGLPFVVLDRPNPLGGNLVEGPILLEGFKSFIGLYPIPYIYGLTVGELAKFFNQEFDIHCDLTVIKMHGWERDMLFGDTGLPWVPTSPHVPHAITPFYIATTGCIGELHAVNVGVGYTLPFELIGQSWIDGPELARELNGRNLSGVLFRSLDYRPYYFTHKDKIMRGVQIHLTSPQDYRPMLIQIHILAALIKLYPDQDIFDNDRIRSFYRAIGTEEVRQQLEQGIAAGEVYQFAQNKLEEYMQRRAKYLLY